jgi:hypothetical protein
MATAAEIIRLHLPHCEQCAGELTEDCGCPDAMREHDAARDTDGPTIWAEHLAAALTEWAEDT